MDDPHLPPPPPSLPAEETTAKGPETVSSPPRVALGPVGVPPPPPPPPPPLVMPVPPEAPPIESKRVLAGVTAILFGFIGLHKFILGYTGEGVVMLLVTFIGGFCTAGVSILATATIGFIEGIVYLSKSDAEFVREYQVGRKEWF